MVVQFGPGSSRIVADHEQFWTELNAGDPSSEEEDDDDDGVEGSCAPRPAHTRTDPKLPKVPQLQAARNNLTALSQVYNLYFTAYRGRIAVYCPNNAQTQILGRRPRLVLRPPAHAHAMQGHLQPRHGHEVNNMKVGFLGYLEIVVMSYDDGDVIAYSTKSVAEAIIQRLGNSGCAEAPSLPRPLLHENVGHSAWGLAVHAKSRLIAVSSNRHEVTVFALALVDKLGFRPRWRPTSPEANVLARKRMWRIVLSLGDDGHNIPSIDFISDPEGFAVQVCAVDINCNLVGPDPSR